MLQGRIIPLLQGFWLFEPKLLGRALGFKAMDHPMFLGGLQLIYSQFPHLLCLPVNTYYRPINHSLGVGMNWLIKTTSFPRTFLCFFDSVNSINRCSGICAWKWDWNIWNWFYLCFSRFYLWLCLWCLLDPENRSQLDGPYFVTKEIHFQGHNSKPSPHPAYPPGQESPP